MRIPIERYAPPGVDVRTEVERTVWGLIAAAVLSLRFFLAYVDKYTHVYDLLEDFPGPEKFAIMPTFRELFSWSFLGFWVFLLAMAALAVFHVAYHYQGGSRPVYLMRRLPDRWEYWRRCLALPAAGALCALVVMAILLGIYLAVYLNCTPAQCLPDPWF